MEIIVAQPRAAMEQSQPAALWLTAGAERSAHNRAVLRQSSKHERAVSP